MKAIAIMRLMFILSPYTCASRWESALAIVATTFDPHCRSHGSVSEVQLVNDMSSHAVCHVPLHQGNAAYGWPALCGAASRLPDTRISDIADSVDEAWSRPWVQIDADHWRFRRLVLQFECYCGIEPIGDANTMDGLIAARVLHVLGVVLWIGGVALVTTVLLPATRRMKTPAERIELFESI